MELCCDLLHKKKKKKESSIALDSWLSCTFISASTVPRHGCVNKTQYLFDNGLALQSTSSGIVCAR